MNYTTLIQCNLHSNYKRIPRIDNELSNLSTTTSFNNHSIFSRIGIQYLSLILFIVGFSGVFTLDSVKAQSPIHIEWEQHSQAVLTKNLNGQGAYGDRIASVSIALRGDTYNYSFSVAEIKNQLPISATETPIQRDVISTEKFPGLEYTFDQDLDYGSWYISALHSDSNMKYLLFRPNSTAINALVQSDSVTSKLTITMHELVNGELVEVAENAIAINIEGESFAVQSHWNSGFDGILKVNKAKQHYDDLSTILYYDDAEYDIEFTSVSETTHSGDQESTVTSTTITPAGVNLGPYDSTNVQQFGDNLTYGTWYIVNSYDCDGPFQCKLLLFRPNVSAINALNGKDIVESMQITYTDSDAVSEVHYIALGINSPETEVSIRNLGCPNNEQVCTSQSIEGEQLEIEVARANNFWNEPMVVELEITETGNMLVDAGIRTVTIDANSLRETITIDTIQDTVHNIDSEVTVTLLYNEEYSVNESQKAFTNIVKDNDISIQLSQMETEISQINEGEVAEFRIVSTNGPAKEDIEINFTLIEEGPDTNNQEFVGGYAIGELPTSLTLPKGEEDVTIVIETLDDTSYRGIGRLKLQLNENPNRYVLADPTNYSTNYIEILENEPSFSITALSDSVMEGDVITYTIAIDGSVQSSQTVSIEFSGDTSFIAGELTRDVEFLPTTIAKPLFIETLDNEIHNAPGTVVATIAADSSYGTESTSASVQILDDEAPIISLSTAMQDTYEDYLVDLQISADKRFTLDLNIQIELSPAELVVGSAIKTVSLPASDPDLSQTLTIQLANNHTHDQRRALTATLLAGDNYNIDEGTGNQVSIDIIEDDYPTLFISGGDPVSEGDSVEFTVIATRIPSEDTLIQYTPSEINSNFLAIPSNQPIRERLVFEQEVEAFVATIVIPVEDDDIFEPDGTISVSLNTSEGYIVAANPNNTASIVVEDNDIPELSIAAGPSVNESSGIATFNVTSTKLPSEPLAVDYLRRKCYWRFSL